jgi:hypothetical protein
MKAKAINAEERRYFEFIKRLPCCVCGSYMSVEAHHITYGTYGRLGHLFAIPLCRCCHRGDRGFSGKARSDWDKGIVFQLNKHKEICQIYGFRIPELPCDIPELNPNRNLMT